MLTLEEAKKIAKDEKIKNCPLCGRKAEIYINEADELVIECENCGLNIASHTFIRIFKRWQSRKSETK